MKNKILTVIRPAALIAVPASLFLCVLTDFDYTALVTLVVCILGLVPFFMEFESLKPRPRDFIHIVILSAAAIVGRIICTPFYSFQPVTAVIIVAGICFGKQSGFLVGAMTALVSNIFLGQGPWTPWQMYAWGLVGYLSGVISKTGIFRKNTSVYIFGFIASMFYGFILDSWYVVGFVKPLIWETALIGYINGIVYNLVHASGTAVFLVAILVPWRRKIERVKLKYGIGNI